MDINSEKFRKTISKLGGIKYNPGDRILCKLHDNDYEGKIFTVIFLDDRGWYIISLENATTMAKRNCRWFKNNCEANSELV